MHIHTTEPSHLELFVLGGRFTKIPLQNKVFNELILQDMKNGFQLFFRNGNSVKAILGFGVISSS